MEWVVCPPPGDISDPGIKPRSPELQADSLPSEPPSQLFNAPSLDLIHQNGNSHWSRQKRKTIRTREEHRLSSRTDAGPILSTPGMSDMDQLRAAASTKQASVL